MRLEASDAQLDCDVADVVLNELGDRHHLGQGRIRQRSQRCHPLLDFRGSIEPAAGQIPVPRSHLLPAGKSIRGDAARGKERHDHLSRNTLQRRHLVFFANALHIVDHPLPLIASSGPGLGFRIVQPRCLVLPPGRQLQRVAALAYRAFVLKTPHVLQDQRLLFHFVLPANNVAGIGRRYAEEFGLHIGDQFAALDLGHRNFHSLFVLDLIIFSLGRDAPAMQAGDLLVEIEGHRDNAMVAASRAQDPICNMDCFLDLVGGQDSDVFFRIQKYGIRLLIMCGQLGVDQRVHPLRRISTGHRQWDEYQQSGRDAQQGPHDFPISCWRWPYPVAGRFVPHRWFAPPGKNS